MMLSIAAALVLASAAASEPPSYPCHAITAAPTVDGQVSEPCWRRLPAATGFYKLGGGYTLAKQTAFRMGWDKRALYVAITCEEPDAVLLKPVGASGDNLWQEDSVEFFLMKPGDARIYQFMIAPGGAHSGMRAAEALSGWSADAAVGQGAYTVELCLPWQALGRVPKPGEVWRGMIGRNIVTDASGGDRFTTSAPLDRMFHEPDHYARFVFRAETLDAAAASQAQAALAAPFRAAMEERIRAVMAKDKQYRTALERSRRVPAFAKAAASLSEQWAAVRQVGERARAAKLTDLRRMLRSSQALEAQTYTHCYTFLMEELFGTP